MAANVASACNLTLPGGTQVVSRVAVKPRLKRLFVRKVPCVAA